MVAERLERMVLIERQQNICKEKLFNNYSNEESLFQTNVNNIDNDHCTVK